MRSSLLLAPLLLVPALLPGGARSQGCDSGWSGSTSLGACYLLGPLTDGVTGTLMTWGDAYSYCISIRQEREREREREREERERERKREREREREDWKHTKKK